MMRSLDKVVVIEICDDRKISRFYSIEKLGKLEVMSCCNLVVKANLMVT